MGLEARKQLGGDLAVRKLAEGGVAEVFLATRRGTSGFTERCVLERIKARPEGRDHLSVLFEPRADDNRRSQQSNPETLAYRYMSPSTLSWEDKSLLELHDQTVHQIGAGADSVRPQCHDDLASTPFVQPSRTSPKPSSIPALSRRARGPA